MQPGRYDLTLWKGDTASLPGYIQWTANSVNVNITGYTVRALGNVPGGVTLFDWSTTNGKLVIPIGTDGIVNFSGVNYTDMQALDPSQLGGKWTLRFTSPGGLTTDLLMGAVTITVGAIP